MKKIIAIVLCVVLSLSLCVSVAAKVSPSAKDKVQVIVKKGSGVIVNADSSTIEQKPDISYAVEEGHSVTVTPDEATYGKFDSWSVYKVVNEGGVVKYVAAVAGVDYRIISGSLTEKSFKFEALRDLIICANFGGTITDPALDSTQAGKKPESPQTSDVAPLVMLTLLASATAIFGFKKVFEK